MPLPEKARSRGRTQSSFYGLTPLDASAEVCVPLESIQNQKDNTYIQYSHISSVRFSVHRRMYFGVCLQATQNMFIPNIQTSTHTLIKQAYFQYTTLCL